MVDAKEGRSEECRATVSVLLSESTCVKNTVLHKVFRQKYLYSLVLHMKTIYKFWKVPTGTGSLVDSKGTSRAHVLTEEKLYIISASRRRHSQEKFWYDLYSR
jgi:hypothetical protein